MKTTRRGFIAGTAGIVAAATGFTKSEAGLLLPADKLITEPLEAGLSFEGIVREYSVSRSPALDNVDVQAFGPNDPVRWRPLGFHDEVDIMLRLVSPARWVGGDVIGDAIRRGGAVRCLITAAT